jgi:hypothetical protein
MCRNVVNVTIMAMPKAIVSTMEIASFAKHRTLQKGNYRDQKKG